MITKMQRMFKDYLLERYKEWENNQPKKISSISAFARWLSENTYEVKISQPLVDDWLTGHIPKTDKYIHVLAEKLGDEIYDVLEFPRPDKQLQNLNRVWKFLPEEVQMKISQEAAKYEAENTEKRIQKSPKRGTAHKPK